MGTLTTAGRSGPARWARIALPIHSDEHLARLVGAGTDRAYALLYQRYHQQLYRYCRSLLGNDADAQDALQSTFVAALSALREGRRDAPLRPWLYRIAHHEAVTLLRRRRRFVEQSEPEPGWEVSAEEASTQRERLVLLMADLGDLPERQRGALVMRELSGLSHEQIAVALQTSPRAAKQAIFEARSALREFELGRAMACEEVCRLLSDGDGRSLRARRVRGHLRSCGACAAFAADIRTRRADLQALAPPLAPVAASGLLATLLGRAGSRHGGALAGVAGKSAGIAVGTKVLVGVTVVAGASVGLSRALPHSHSRANHTAIHPTLLSPPRHGHHAAAAAPGSSRAAAGHTHAAAGAAPSLGTTGSREHTTPGSSTSKGRAVGHGREPAAHAHGRGRAGERPSHGPSGGSRANGSHGHAVKPKPTTGKPTEHAPAPPHPAPHTLSPPEATGGAETPGAAPHTGARAKSSPAPAGEALQHPVHE
jgi:RNA polymerase sigma factor (sigma-70 family)